MNTHPVPGTEAVRTAAAIRVRPWQRALWMVAAVAIAWSVVPSLHAGAIIAGNLVVYRVGDGAAALGTSATAVFLDEYTLAGTLVQSIPLPATGADSLTAVGSATAEGLVALSQDRSTLVFTGYRKDAGGSNPSTDAPGTTHRVIATVGLSGVVNTSRSLTDVNTSIRSAVTVDNSTYYIGASTGVRYTDAPGPAGTSVQIDSRNSRQVLLNENTLYASNGSTAITAKVQSYGVLPTGATSAIPLVNLATTDAVNGFFLFDLSASIPGIDTIYLLSTVESLLRKYTFDGTTWLASGSTSAGSAQNLTGLLDAGVVRLYLSAPASLVPFLDPTGYNGSIDGLFTEPAIAVAAQNTAFRGIGIIPIPEPSTAAVFSLMLMSVVARRARK